MKSSFVIALVSLILASAITAQEAVTVESATIIDYGIYRIELTGQRVQVPSTGAGGVRPASRAVLIAETNEIPAILGTTFGLQFTLNGDPAGAMAEVEIVVEHPAFKKPGGTTTGTLDKVLWRYRIGEKIGYTYTFDHDWEVAPGKWKIEVRRNGKRLVGKDFLIKPKN